MDHFEPALCLRMIVHLPPSTCSSYSNARPYLDCRRGKPMTIAWRLTSLNQNVMNSGMRFCPTHRPSSAASSFERRSIIRSMRELGSATRPNFSAYMSHSTSRRIALLTRRFTLTPSRSPNLRRKSSTSRSMRIVRVTLLLGGNPLLPTGDPSTTVYVKLPNALLADDGRSFVEAKADDDLVLRLLDLDVSLQVVVKRGPNGLLVERRPFRAAPVFEDDGAPVPFLELLVGEGPPILRE